MHEKHCMRAGIEGIRDVIVKRIIECMNEVDHVPTELVEVEDRRRSVKTNRMELIRIHPHKSRKLVVVLRVDRGFQVGDTLSSCMQRAVFEHLRGKRALKHP